MFLPQNIARQQPSDDSPDSSSDSSHDGNVDNSPDANHGSGGVSGPTVGYIIVGVILGSVALIFIIFLVARTRRKGGARGGYHQTRDGEEPVVTRPPPNFDAAVSEANRNANVNNGADVDRHVSIRSIITLPAYRNKANEDEQVIGREGDRDGVDMVLELPSAERDEELRDEEMETAYRLRLARRQQNAARDERTRLSREARARGDSMAMRELRERAAQSRLGVNDLEAEHQRLKQERLRAVSSVSYADLGVARHDGTRLRANSTESERTGLLSDAASIAASARSPTSMQHGGQSPTTHHRVQSSTSVVSFDSAHDYTRPGGSTSRLTQHTNDSTTRHSTQEADLGAEMPLPSPPSYDDVSLDEPRSRAGTPMGGNEPPPTYPGPTEARDRRLNDHVSGMVHSVDHDGDLSSRRLSGTSRGSRTSLQRLPSLQVESVPQIVVEPSSARPRETSPGRSTIYSQD